MAVAALSLPLTALGHDTLIIPLGAAARQCKNNSIGFADLETPWLKSFFEEHSLSENRMQKATGTLEVSREGPCVRVKLSLEISPTLECVRSLTHFEQHLNVHGNALFMIKKPLKPLRGTSGRKFTAATEDELDDDGIQLNESDLEIELNKANMFELAKLGMKNPAQDLFFICRKLYFKRILAQRAPALLLTAGLIVTFLIATWLLFFKAQQNPLLVLNQWREFIVSLWSDTHSLN